MKSLFYFSNLVILVTLVCLVVATVSAASAALLSCRVRCLYHCIYHLLMANKVMMMMSVQVTTVADESRDAVRHVQRVVNKGGRWV